MKTTGLTELRAHLSEYVRMVERGQGLLVTRHGKPIARLVPIERSSAADPAREKRLEEMEKAGLIRRGRGGPLPEDFFDLLPREMPAG